MSSNSRVRAFGKSKVTQFLTMKNFEKIAKIMKRKLTNVRSLFSGSYGSGPRRMLKISRRMWMQEVTTLQDEGREVDGQFISNCFDDAETYQFDKHGEYHKIICSIYG